MSSDIPCRDRTPTLLERWPFWKSLQRNPKGGVLFGWSLTATLRSRALLPSELLHCRGVRNIRVSASMVCCHLRLLRHLSEELCMMYFCSVDLKLFLFSLFFVTRRFCSSVHTFVLLLSLLVRSGQQICYGKDLVAFLLQTFVSFWFFFFPV